MQKIIFICLGNICRSSLVEGVAKAHVIDISHQRSQHVSDFDLFSYDLVVAMDESNKIALEQIGLVGV